MPAELNWPIRRPDPPSPFLKSAVVLLVPLLALVVVLVGIFAYQSIENHREQRRFDAQWRQWIDDVVASERQRAAGLPEGYTIEETGTWAAMGDPHGCIEVGRLLVGEPSFFDDLRLSNEVATEYFNRLC